jgi:hypothetical protein
MDRRASPVSPRRDISIPRDEAEQFLRRQDHVVLVANDDTGVPLATRARARFDGDQLLVTVPADDPLVGALAADTRACAIAEQFPSYYGIKAVIVHGAVGAPTHHDGGATYAMPLERLTTFDFGRLPEASPRLEQLDPQPTE